MYFWAFFAKLSTSGKVLAMIMPNDPDYKKGEEQSVFRFNLSSFKVRLPCLQLSIVQSRGLREKGRCSELISR